MNQSDTMFNRYPRVPLTSAPAKKMTYLRRISLIARFFICPGLASKACGDFGLTLLALNDELKL